MAVKSVAASLILVMTSRISMLCWSTESRPAAGRTKSLRADIRSLLEELENIVLMLEVESSGVRPYLDDYCLGRRSAGGDGGVHTCWGRYGLGPGLAEVGPDITRRVRMKMTELEQNQRRLRNMIKQQLEAPHIFRKGDWQASNKADCYTRRKRN